MYSILYGYFCELYTVWSFLWALYCVVIFMSSKLCGSFMSSTVYCAFPKNLISFSLIVSRGLSPLFSRKLSCWNAWQRFHHWTNVWNLNSQKEPNNNDDMFPFRLWHFYSLSNSKLTKSTKHQWGHVAFPSMTFLLFVQFQTPKKNQTTKTTCCLSVYDIVTLWSGQYRGEIAVRLDLKKQIKRILWLKWDWLKTCYKLNKLKRSNTFKY